jgi:hypothetical protein
VKREENSAVWGQYSYDAELNINYLTTKSVSIRSLHEHHLHKVCKVAKKYLEKGQAYSEMEFGSSAQYHSMLLQKRLVKYSSLELLSL